MNSKSIITPLKPINKIYKDLKFSIKKNIYQQNILITI